MIRNALATASGGARVVALRKIGDNGAGGGRRPSDKRCFDCGLEYPHKLKPCPAKGKTCNKCKKIGIFAKCCRTKVVRRLAQDSESEQEAQGSLVGSVRSKAFQIAAVGGGGPMVLARVYGRSCRMLILRSR